ncbi:MAG: hypothetical protein H0T84_05615 [Tatlockia sp.]|nr:hypothetical protein [Tatlockia sp.]
MSSPNLPMQNNRITTYGAVATELALLSDKHLLKLLGNVTSQGTSIGGQTALLKIGNANIFVKKVPLTNIEKQPENVMSTANMFELPPNYQYGIGSLDLEYGENLPLISCALTGLSLVNV